ncbi:MULTISPECIES: YchJ family protein [unclassified Streptomyces]|uniref:YchJ family protein n=1 Tax=unclassified Streptomyces TaxID=2593676 RepID=UPI002254A962|nr:MULTISPECIES: YchJ family metal-binding protein [unclassified Streptomyces]MCX5144302.1 YchJ family metal-binding protein [Streptomyces sp. NBC_00338]WRZ68670.1 YchJ family metal-binding protein [Streptomyces sp. NBC_01257]WSU62628.1 YchJ family metal-binding protein [Streptomyces sp. NBC_01104]
MSRRTSRPRRPAAAPLPQITDASPCPCGLSAAYGACCGRFHAGTPAPTCEALMRSRYAAFVVGDAAYLLRTWHPDHRPAVLDLDPGQQWQGLEILETTEGSAFHTTGTVTFRAHYTAGGHRDSLHEKSRFVRHEGAWVYESAVFAD